MALIQLTVIKLSTIRLQTIQTNQLPVDNQVWAVKILMLMVFLI